MEDTIKGGAEGFMVVRDLESGEILAEQNAVHFGNLSAIIALALSGNEDGHIRFVAFGNGGTSITQTGVIFYKVPNTSTVRNYTDSLYNETYVKDISVNTDQNNITVVLSSSNYADIKVKATLGFGEPSDQDLEDNAVDFDGDYVFDEIALKSDEGVLLTHVLFHPVQKAQNRAIEIEYTLRIQMG